MTAEEQTVFIWFKGYYKSSRKSVFPALGVLFTVYCTVRAINFSGSLIPAKNVLRRMPDIRQLLDKFPMPFISKSFTGDYVY